MTREQFHREKAYQITLAIARSMLQKALINQDEYDRFDNLMLDKYQPLLGTLRH